MDLKTTFYSATCKTLGCRVNWFKKEENIVVKTLTIKGWCWLTISVDEFLRGYSV